MSGAYHAVAATARGATIGITDADLVVRARDGDGWALDALYRRHARSVGGLAARLLGTRQDVDDVVHDAFVSAFEKLHTLRDADAFRAWLMRITVMRVRQVLRRRKLRAALGLSYALPDASLEALASSDMDPERRTELRLIDAVLAELPADLRIAWMLRHVEGHELEDVARHCGCSLSTVKRRLEAASTTVERTLRSRGWSA